MSVKAYGSVEGVITGRLVKVGVKPFSGKEYAILEFDGKTVRVEVGQPIIASFSLDINPSVVDA